jgi:alpha-beta hydrolase superfamily lysophospholipase
MSFSTPITADGLRLFTRSWHPKGPRRAALVLVHGYAEHSGRYDHLAATFASLGVATYAFDLRGFGQSEGRRAYVDHFDQYLDDLALVLEHVPSQDRPLFLFGHSMGGLIALKFVLDRQPDLQGLLLNAPALQVNPDLAPILRRFARLLGRLAPTLPTVRSPQGAISRDPAVVAAANADPLNYHGRIPARTGAELLRVGADMRSRFAELTTPFLVLQGTGDRLTTPAWSERLYAQAASTDKTLKLYEGLYHETFHEPEQDQVLQDVRDWLAAHLPHATPTD